MMITKTTKLSFLFTIVLVTVLSGQSHAFTTSSGAGRNPIGILARRQQQQTTTLCAREGDKEGGAAIAKPKIGQKTAVEVQTKQKVQIKRKIKPAEPVQRREEEFQDAPMYKLMLIGDDAYDPTHVVERMCAVIDDMDEDQAAEVFKQAEMNGKAMCGKFPYERAELFKEQLQRSDPMIFSEMEEENA